MPDFGFDDWMDAQLRNVPVPRDLAGRIASARTAPSDEQLDAELREVPVPVHLERRLKRIPWQNRGLLVWRSTSARLALAASVVMMLGGAAFVALRITADESRTTANDNPANDHLANDNLDKQPTPGRANRGRRIATQPVQAPRTPRMQEPETVPLGEPPREALVGGDEHSALSPFRLDGVATPFRLDGVTTFGAALKRAAESKSRQKAALGFSGRFEPLPDLEAYEPAAARGILPPRVPGYDLLFQLKNGQHPFVSPSAHADLRASRMPLVFRTTSFDEAMALADDGQSLAADEVRVEDFLAAQRYALPEAPQRGLALHAGGMASPWGEPGLHTLQLAVQAAAPRPANRPGVHLIAVVDTSAAMQARGRHRAVERAFLELHSPMHSPMQSADRLTVLGFAAAPQVLAENISAAEINKLVASGAFAPRGQADFAAAVQAAAQAVLAVKAKETRRVVLVTSGRVEFDSEAMRPAAEALSRLATAGVTWHIVRLSTWHAPQWDAFAKDHGGTTSLVDSAAELQARFRESLTGATATVAQAVSLKITFNPQVVTSYRLVGHESATSTGDANDPLELDLAAGQTAVGLHEMWLKRTGGDEVATIELAWRDPANGQPRRHVQKVQRGQLAQSFGQAAPWLQQGVLAAQTAEMLRGSYYVPSSRRFEQVLALTPEIDASVARQPEFQALLRLIKFAAGMK